MELEARLEFEYEIGKKRKERIKDALQDLKDEGFIRDYLHTRDMSFLIIYIKERYKICPVRVSRSDIHQNLRGQSKYVITVNLWEDLNSIKKKIMRAIEAKERGWLLKRF